MLGENRGRSPHSSSVCQLLLLEFCTSSNLVRSTKAILNLVLWDKLLFDEYDFPPSSWFLSLFVDVKRELSIQKRHARNCIQEVFLELVGLILLTRQYFMSCFNALPVVIKPPQVRKTFSGPMSNRSFSQRICTKVLFFFFQPDFSYCNVVGRFKMLNDPLSSTSLCILCCCSVISAIYKIKHLKLCMPNRLWKLPPPTPSLCCILQNGVLLAW